MPQAGQEEASLQRREQESLPRPKNGINLKLKKGDKDTYCLGRTYHRIDPSSANGKGDSNQKGEDTIPRLSD